MVVARGIDWQRLGSSNPNTAQRKRTNMAAIAHAVVMTCIENPANGVEGVDTRTFTVHAVMQTPSNVQEIYTAKIIEPAIIVAGVISVPILLERDEFFFKTRSRIEPDTRLMIEISLAGPSTLAVAEPGSGI